MGDWCAQLERLERTSNCRITTRGRRTGKSHTVTTWFAVGDDGTICLGTLRMNRDWPKNVAKHPDIEIAIGDLKLRGEARLVTEEPKRSRIEDLLRRKYLVSRIAGWLGFRPEGVFEIRITGEASEAP
ncbi:MAG: nitroreductase/quinone reductase family protein [Candidatus Binatia bacterium]